MPAKHKKVCQLLMDGYSIREIAAMTGTSASSIRRRMAEIREIFVQKGIDCRFGNK